LQLYQDINFSDHFSKMTSKVHSVAILDDYQNVALKYGNWAPIEKHATVTVFNDTIHSEDDLVARLKPFTIICTMRERTKFSASLLKRLPNLKLLTTTGMRNPSLDIHAANAQGVVVAGTGGIGNATLEHIWALILGVTRHIAEEDRNMKEGGVWQSTISTGLKGRTLGLIGLGNLGSETAKYSAGKK
jgi:phosphoglycerate dehydrogenase-like enzyme